MISGDGGLREAQIDTETPDLNCVRFLQDVFHSKVENFAKPTGEIDNNTGSEASENDLDYMGPVCHRKFGGLCEQTSRGVDISVACKLVRIFNRAVKERMVKVGSLISMKSASPHPFFGFVGVCTQRPILHVLLKVDFIGEGGMEEVILWHDPDHPNPIFSTSHLVFQQLISKSDDVVAVEVYEYTLHRRGVALHVQPLRVCQSFTLDPEARGEARQPRPKLRFAIRVPKMKKDRKKRKKKKKDKENKSKSKGGKTRKTDKASHEGSSGSSGGPSEEQAVPHNDNGFDIREESDLCSALAISADAEREETKANEMMVKQEGLRDAADSMQSAPVAPANKPLQQPAESSQQNTNKSFFAKQCGLDDVGIAVSNRSKCYFCGAKIPKGDIRFQWHWNTLRPSVWVHSGCLKSLVQRDGHLDHTLQKLEEMRLFSRSASSSSDDPISEAVSQASSALASFKNDATPK